MKWGGADIHCPMNVGGFAEPNLAKFPLALDRLRPQTFYPKPRISQCDYYIVIAMNMPQRRVSRGHSNIPDADEFIFEPGMMAWLATDLYGRLRRVRLRKHNDRNRRDSKEQAKRQ